MDYLVAISIGPVQSLIEAGRRAQDLWCGSWLLSEVARAVALKLHQTQNGCLI
ncbi:type III-B CRISPR-associated protein Cas10/Cmr2 [Shewanella putrefaciens]